MSRIKGKGKKGLPALSTASLPDIIFMLLFFFMVVTKMRKDDLLVKFELPSASETQKLERPDLVGYIYVGTPTESEKYGTSPRMQLNDKFASKDDIPEFVEFIKSNVDEKEQDDVVFAFKVDEEASTGIITDVKQELREQYALNVRYTVLPSAE